MQGPTLAAGAAARPDAVPLDARRPRLVAAVALALRELPGRHGLTGAAVRTAISLRRRRLSVALAVLAALLARDVRSWPSALASGDAAWNGPRARIVVAVDESRRPVRGRCSASTAS